MDKLEELQRKREQIRQERAAKQPSKEHRTPSTAAASDGQPPAPPLTEEQARQLITEALRAQKEEHARSEQSWMAQIEGLKQLIESLLPASQSEALWQRLCELEEKQFENNTARRTEIESLERDTRASLRLIAQRQVASAMPPNENTLPRAAEETARNVTPRPRRTVSRETLPESLELLPGSLPDYQPTAPPSSGRSVRVTTSSLDYRPPAERAWTSREEWTPPPASLNYRANEEQRRQPETATTTPKFLKIIYAMMVLMVLAVVICVGVSIISWMWANPWTAAATILLLTLVLGWMSAVWLTWKVEFKAGSILIVLFGTMLILLATMGYGAYQLWVPPAAAEAGDLGR